MQDCLLMDSEWQCNEHLNFLGQQSVLSMTFPYLRSFSVIFQTWKISILNSMTFHFSRICTNPVIWNKAFVQKVINKIRCKGSHLTQTISRALIGTSTAQTTPTNFLTAWHALQPLRQKSATLGCLNEYQICWPYFLLYFLRWLHMHETDKPIPALQSSGKGNNRLSKNRNVITIHRKWSLFSEYWCTESYHTLQSNDSVSLDDRVPPVFQHWFSMTKKWKSMTYRRNMYFQVNDTWLMNAYQN